MSPPLSVYRPERSSLAGQVQFFAGRIAGGSHPGGVVLGRTYLIRPPRPQFTFTGVHGVSAGRTCSTRPNFAELVAGATRLDCDDAAFLAAHNARFRPNRFVHACCARYRLRRPRTSFTCTVQLARTQWRTRPTNLPRRSVASCTSHCSTTTPEPTHGHAHAKGLWRQITMRSISSTVTVSAVRS